MRIRYYARYLIWAAMALLTVRGCVSLLRPPAPPARAAVAPVPPPAPGPDVLAYAAAFAREYLAWEPGRAQEREARLKAFAARSVDPAAWALGPDVQPQVAGAALPFRAETLDPHRTLVTVQVATAARVRGERGESTVARTLYLAVPVYRGEDGSLAVYAPPLLVPPPRLADAGSEGLPGRPWVDTTGKAAQAVEGFWRAYAAGGPGDVEAYMLPGTPPPDGHRGAVQFRGVSGVQFRDLGEGRILATGIATLQDPITRAEFRQPFRLSLAQRDGRWYVTSPPKGA